MRLLLDTHVVLWWQTDDRRLRADARHAIATADLVWVSAASGWEVAIKSALGRLDLNEPFPLLVETNDFTGLPVTLEHAARLGSLPAGAGDPFDRLLAAQALAEQATLVTHDPVFAGLGVPTLWT